MNMRFFVPAQPECYVELIPDTSAIAIEWEQVGALWRLHARGFKEVLIASGGKLIRVRCDTAIPPHVPLASSFDRTSKLIIDVKKKDVLEIRDDLELQLHLSTPLAPRDCGIWARLALKYENNRLNFRGNHGPYQGCHLELSAADGEQPDDETSVPDWLNNPDARWTVTMGKESTAGNTLLSLAADRPLANLLALDPTRSVRKNASLSLYLEKRQDEYLVCTELMIKPSVLQRAPISGYALHLHASERGSAPFAAAGLRWRCEQRAERSGWVLHWDDLPGAQQDWDSDALTLESLTQALLDQHAAGLATVRSRNRLSFVPSWICTQEPAAMVSLRFEVWADAAQIPKETRLQRIIASPAQGQLALHFAGVLDAGGKHLVLNVQAAEVQQASPWLMDWTLLASPGTVPARLGIGAVLLTVDGFTGGTLQLGVDSGAADYRRAALRSSLQLTFHQANYTALSMDPELGFETLSADTQRARPWTFDLSGEQACLLTISESASQQQSRLLSMELKLPAAGTRYTDVVLIDPSPLTVVRLQNETRQYGNEILAQYIDDADQAPEWRFYSLDGSMTAILPPQGIGEEMIKGRLHLERGGVRIRVPADHQLFDFRLTPVARLALDRTDVDSARSEAPWSLRRLLGRRLGATGVKLERAEFELLYGMAAKVETSGLRIAELDGYIGRIPFADELRRTRRGAADPVVQAQGAALEKWIAALWQRPSWWRVYADLSNRERLTIDQGVSYQLRPSRQTANPFNIGAYASPNGVVAHREPLRGGVDWPFQSQSVYDELQPHKPTRSSAGAISGLVFGALGGEGAQTAAYNNGKTIIITNSHQSRLDALTLIRVGRIAMLWNKARHVIVYARTTECNPRYQDDGLALAELLDDLEVQPPFEGLAALRKVDEYVEITEPRRSYPDVASDRPACGPLVQSVFSTRVIRVRSDWGRDLRDGFAIALRGPVPPGKEAEFPDPQVFLDFARASEKGEGGIGQRIINTQQLVFFTSTRNTDGGDTERWPAWPDVDFPLIRPAAPPALPFSSSFKDSKWQPDAAPVELGMRRFTFTLEPAEEAANLMHDRPVRGLESRIFNINLARGLPATEPVMNPAQRAALDAGAGLGAVHAVLLDGLAELRNELGARVRAGQSFSLGEQPQLQQDAASLLSRLADSVRQAEIPVTAAAGRDWAAQQLDWGKAYQDGVKNELAGLQSQLLAQTLGTDLEQARASASAIVEAVGKQAQQRIASIGFAPMQALDAARNGIAAVQHRLDGAIVVMATEALQLLDDLERRYQLDPDTAVTLELLWRDSLAQLPARLAQLLDNLGRMLEGELGAWFSRMQKGGASTIYDLAQGGATRRLEAVADWLSRWAESLPPFDLGAPDFGAMREVFSGVLSKALMESVLQDVGAWLQANLAEVEHWTDMLEQQVEALRKWEANLAQQIAAATQVDALRSWLAEAEGTLNQTMMDAAKEVQKQLNDAVAGLSFGNIQGELNSLQALKQDADNAIKNMAGALNSDLAALEKMVREQAGEIEQRLQASARQVEDWISKEVGESYQLAKENIDSGLQTLRVLAEGPVTDGLRVTRERLGYYFHNAELGVMLTRASAVFNELPGDVLNALSLDMPFDRLTDRLRACVGGMMVRDLFPRLAGIDMSYLLPDLDVPLEGDQQFDWLRLQHGFDKDRLRAWAQVTINKRFDADATLFNLGPIKLRLLRPLFAGSSNITIDKNGLRTQKTSAQLNADFQLSLNDHPVVTLHDGTLSFNESGKLDFQLDASQIELAAELQFLSDAIKAWKPDFDGFTLTPLLPGGISTGLSLPLPDIGTGAFTLTGITLNTHFDLRIADGFEIATGLWLSKPDRPFGLAVLFLGGGGWFGIDASYRPPARFQTRVSIGISAGAFIAVNFGFAGGSAGILFTASVDFYRDWQSGTGSTAITLGIIIWGEFSVLGIASASMRLVLRVSYQDGNMSGTGQFSVSIRICWCYTLRVNRTVYKQFAGSGGARAAGAAKASLLHVAAAQPADVAATARSEAKAAVAAYLATLAIVSPP